MTAAVGAPANARVLAEQFMSYLKTGTAGPDLYAPDVFLDVRLPRWRLQARGRADALAVRRGNHPQPATSPGGGSTGSSRRELLRMAVGPSLALQPPAATRVLRLRPDQDPAQPRVPGLLRPQRGEGKRHSQARWGSFGSSRRRTYACGGRSGVDHVA
jgi:hypothetical protein